MCTPCDFVCLCCVQRRWLAFCNPKLRDLITGVLGTEKWITNLDLLAGLREYADDPELQQQWQEVSRRVKVLRSHPLLASSGSGWTDCTADVTSTPALLVPI
jgi:glucan phosphorylase